MKNYIVVFRSDLMISHFAGMRFATINYKHWISSMSLLTLNEILVQAEKNRFPCWIGDLTEDFKKQAKEDPVVLLVEEYSLGALMKCEKAWNDARLFL